MAKVAVMGNAIIVTSSVKLEDLKTVQKYRPCALTLYGGEDGKEPIFAVKVGCNSSINKYGATFAEATRGENGGYATMTIVDDICNDDPAGFVAEKYGTAIANLNALEATLEEVLQGIVDERNAVMESITVVQ